jgi:hypothetical protein
MRRRGFLPIGRIGAVLAVAMAAPLLAQQSSAPSGQSAPSGRPPSTTTTSRSKSTNIPESQLRKVTVRVRDVDPGSHTVVLEAHVSPEANITSNGQPITIDQLKPGDEIRASFDPKTGDMIKVETVKQGSAPAK